MLVTPERHRTPPESLPGLGAPGSLLARAVARRSAAMFQRIGWLRPSAAEQRLWLVQGAVILGAVALIGALMFLLLR